MPGPRVSILIPARNDAAALDRTLDRLAGVAGIEAAEIIVAAAGDPVGTVRAIRGRARLLWPDDAARAGLMNAAASAASGKVLFFLHADSAPPKEALRLMEVAFFDDRVVGGVFAHCFTEPDWRLQIISGINRLRYRLTRNYSGDPGIFVRGVTFRQLGEYKPLRLMGELDFSRRLKRMGRSLARPRRWSTREPKGNWTPAGGRGGVCGGGARERAGHRFPLGTALACMR